MSIAETIKNDQSYMKYIVTLKEAILTSTGPVTSLEVENAVADALSPSGCLEAWTPNSDGKRRFIIPISNILGVIELCEGPKAHVIAPTPEEIELRMRCLQLAWSLPHAPLPQAELAENFYQFITKGVKG